MASIDVTGHTDPMGTDRYNRKVSERGAVAVKEQLVADGVVETDLGTSGVGEAGLLVSTPDGVCGRQSRRAEIVRH